MARDIVDNPVSYVNKLLTQHDILLIQHSLQNCLVVGKRYERF